MPNSQTLLDRASDILFENRSGSAALLQRQLQIGYGEAMRLIAQIASRGWLEAPNPDGQYRFHLGMKIALAGTDAERNAFVLRDLALYLIECDGLDTRCIKLLLHGHTCELSVLLGARRGFDAGGPEPVLGLAKILAALPQLAHLAASPAWTEALFAACAGIQPHQDQKEGSSHERRRQGLVRAIRYMETCLHRGHAPHSRCVEYFVHDSLVPTGRGLEGTPSYREHVVPCALLCAEASRMLLHAISVEDTAQWIEPYLRIVVIDRSLATLLDGELRMRDVMPPGWEFGRGCIYARLHTADILFTPPADGPECCGWTIDRHI